MTGRLSHKSLYEQVAQDATEHYTMLAPLRRLHETIRMCLSLPATKTIDIGCGDGTLLWSVSEQLGTQGTGVDLSETRLRQAKRKGIANTACADAIELPFRSDTFDLCTCTEVLEHLERPEVAISEIHRILKKSGRLVLAVPVVGWYRLLEAKLTGDLRFLNEIEHLREYAPIDVDRCVTTMELQSQLEAAGFRVLTKQGVYFHPRGERFWNAVFGDRSPLFRLGDWLDHQVGSQPRLADWGRYVLLECIKV